VNDKHFYMQFNVGDWLKDPAVSSCSAATRGVWVDLLCAMHEAGRSGILSKTPAIMARLGRCTAAELDHALTELQATGAADVTFRNGNVTITNRRMKREYEVREAARLRKQKSRNAKARDGDVTTTPEPEPEIDTENQSSGSSGVSMKTRGGDLDDAVLADRQAFRNWVKREKAYHKTLIACDDDEQLALACREKAIADKSLKRPVGFVKATLMHAKKNRAEAWSRVNGSHEDAAKAAGRQATEPSRIVSDLAEKFKPKDGSR